MLVRIEIQNNLSLKKKKMKGYERAQDFQDN